MAWKTKITDEQIAELRGMLIELRTRIGRLASTLAESTIGREITGEAGNLSTMPIHFADVGSDESAYDLNLGLTEMGHQELLEIEDALGKMSRGEYGRCESCGGNIGFHRLQAIPYVRLCIACQTRVEKIR